MKKVITIIIAFHLLLFTFHESKAQDTIYVPQDYPSIQLGIDAAQDGNIVLVDTGTYLENINFKGKAITLTSKFIYSHDEFYRENTIIDGSNPPNPDSASVICFHSGEDSTSVLYGFTITGGSGTITYWGIEGGGIYLRNSGAKIVFNQIAGNDLYNDDPSHTGITGGGIAALYLNTSKTVWIENNTIIDNDLEASQGYVLGGGISGHAGNQAWIYINNNTIKDNDIYGTDENTLGGGIYLEMVNGSVNGNTIRNNSCTSIGELFTLGGGLSFDAVNYSMPYKLVMTNNIIDSNSVDGYYGYGAGVRARRGIVEIENNLFNGNVIAETPQWNFGAGLCVYSIGQFGGFIRNNEFIDNINNDGVGGGLFLRCWDFYQEIEVDGNYFKGNIANIGGAVRAYECGVDFINNVFENNLAHNSGGACALKGTSDNPVAHPYRIINNTFFDNNTSHGGAILSDQGDLFILNSIFYGDTANTGSEIRNLAGSLEIAFSNIDTNLIHGDFTNGHGIINEDPMFCTGSHPCMLDTLSPCIDAGVIEYTCPHDSTFWCPDHDMLGVPRPLGDGADMGAYELDFSIGIVELESNTVHNYPNPTRGIVNLHFTLDDLQYVSISIYDLQGREVASILDRNMPPGEHIIQNDVSKIPNGIYVIVLKTGNEILTNKLVKL